MIMNDKGKLFGVISIVDILVILAVLVCAAGVYVRFVSLPKKVATVNTTFKYKVLVEGIRQVSVDAFYKSKELETVFQIDEKGRSDIMGKLVDVQDAPATNTVTKINGEAVLAEMPSRRNVILTLEIEGQVNDGGYYTADLRNIGAGGKMYMRNKFTKSLGTIIAVDI